MISPTVTETIRAGHFAEFLAGHTFVGTGTGLPVEHTTDWDDPDVQAEFLAEETRLLGIELGY